jgi:hypothetical protein
MEFHFLNSYREFSAPLPLHARSSCLYVRTLVQRNHISEFSVWLPANFAKVEWVSTLLMGSFFSLRIIPSQNIQANWIRGVLLLYAACLSTNEGSLSFCHGISDVIKNLVTLLDVDPGIQRYLTFVSALKTSCTFTYIGIIFSLITS